MSTYHRITEITDNGPYVVKLILPLPCQVSKADLKGAFSVYAECRGEEDGQLRSKKDKKSGLVKPLAGYPDVIAAYPCDQTGKPLARGSFCALELGEDYLNKRILGDILKNEWLDNFYRVTQIKPLPGAENSPELPTVGLVFDQVEEDLCPDLAGWETALHQDPEHPLRYAWFAPKEQKETLPLVIWLHGAGEGGQDIRIVNTGNKVTALSGREIQAKLGGAAWVLVPQCPTVWMDDGKEQLGRSNESVYVGPLMRLIDDFITAHRSIDPSRIYVGGLSNGGFMTIRLLRDFPGFFAGAIAVCTPWFHENLTPEVLEAVKQTPLWLIHCKTDTLVPVHDTALPLYHALKTAGAEVHMSLFDKLVDLTGRYKDQLSRPRESFGHCVWIHAYNDDAILDLDGSRVIYGGTPVTAWEWLGKHRLED